MEQVAAARKQRDALKMQLQARQARAQAGADAEMDPEEEVKKIQQGEKKNQVRRMSFGKKDKEKERGSAADGDGGEPKMKRNPSFGKGSTVGRVLSFGRKKKTADGGADGSAKPDGDGEGAEVTKRVPSFTGNLVRKLSFGRKK